MPNTQATRTLEVRTRRALARLRTALNEDQTPTFISVTLTGLTASRLVESDASQTLASVSDLTSWVGGTTNQIVSSDDGDGTITLSLPQDYDTAAEPTLGGLTLSDYLDFDVVSSLSDPAISGRIVRLTSDNRLYYGLEE